MIFLTLGTQACDFSRCMKMIEELTHKRGIKDNVIAQVGYTSYRPLGIDCYDFISENKYEQLIDEADIIISHAGTGALISAIKKGKKVIAVARLAKYGEMVDDHQTEIVQKLTTEGYILDGTYSIIHAWDKLHEFNPRPNDFKFIVSQRIEDLLTEWSVKKK